MKSANLCCSLCRRCNNRSFCVIRVLAAHCGTHIVSLVLGVMYFWFRLSVTFSLKSAFSAFSVGSTRWFSMVFSTSTPKVQRNVNRVRTFGILFFSPGGSRGLRSRTNPENAVSLLENRSIHISTPCNLSVSPKIQTKSAKIGPR